MPLVTTPILAPFASTLLNGQSFEYSSSFLSISSLYICLARAWAGSMAFFLGSRTYFLTGTSCLSSSFTRLLEWQTLVVILSMTSVSNLSEISNAAFAKSRHSALSEGSIIAILACGA